jgi:hypothetical protein
MREIKTITWRALTGNKFLKALHPAMLSKENYVCTQRIRRTGDPEPEIFKVLYDREYAVNYLCRKLCRPLSFLGKEELFELFSEAWTLYAKESLSPFQNDGE